MKRKITVLTLSAMLFALCISAQAQQPKKVFRIGYLSAGDPGTESARSEAFRVALRERGYIEGQNISIEYRYAKGKIERLPQLATELVRLKVDVMVLTGGDRQIRAAKNATKTIPIVMTGQGVDPVKAGLVESLARPGGNITGFTKLTWELGGKRLELLKEAIPKLARVAAIAEPVPASEAELKNLQASARTLGLTIRLWEVGGAGDFEKVFIAMSKQRPDGLYMQGGPLTFANLNQIVKFTLTSRLPSLYPYGEAVDAGGLIYYGADLADSYPRVANYVDKILKGAKPADLPIEQPTKFEIVFNLKTAKQIGVAIPPDVLARATRIIR